jgi:hypothetical protein
MLLFCNTKARKMTLTVRLPPRVEQALAEYCVTHNTTKTQAVKQALGALLVRKAQAPSAYDLGKDLFGADKGGKTTAARNSKRLLRERFRGKPAR